jgi:hypothetical protein
MQRVYRNDRITDPAGLQTLLSTGQLPAGLWEFRVTVSPAVGAAGVAKARFQVYSSDDLVRLAQAFISVEHDRTEHLEFRTPLLEGERVYLKMGDDPLTGEMAVSIMGYGQIG